MVYVYKVQDYLTDYSPIPLPTTTNITVSIPISQLVKFIFSTLLDLDEFGKRA